MKEKRYIILVFLALLYGCETEVNNVSLPEFKPEIAVSSFITPGTTITYADVSTTRRIFGELGYDYLKGAVSVKFSDDEKEIEMERTDDKFFFTDTSIKISPGRIYSIKITSGNYPEAIASTTVPDRLHQEIKIDTFSILRSEAGFTWRDRMFRLSFTDQPLIENYYRVLMKFVSYNFPEGFRGYIIDEYIWLEKDLFSDKNLSPEGKIIIEDKLNYYPSSYTDSAFLKVYVLNTDKSYYLFHKSIRDYDGDPAPFTEPSFVYSNVEGGVGIFSSFTTDSLIIRLK